MYGSVHDRSPLPHQIQKYYGYNLRIRPTRHHGIRLSSVGPTLNHFPDP